MKKQIRKIVSLILAATVLFSAAAVGMPASAISVSKDFYTTDGVTGFNYTVTDGKIEIGNMIMIGDFHIPESIDGYPVTSVKGSSDGLNKSVYIPDSVESFIAFYNPEKYIVDENNPNYSSDEHGVLFDKNKETLIYYPAANLAEEYKVPASVKYISEGAFAYAIHLENLVLNEGLLEIDEYAFEDTYSLKTVNIPSSVTFVSRSAFRNCYALEFIDVDDNNAYYTNDEYGAFFSKDKTKLYKYPSCNPAESYVVPEGVTSVTFEDGGPTLRAFDAVKYLKEVTIPSSMERLSSYGFQKFEKINVSPDNPYYTSIDGVVYNKDGTELVRYPGQKKESCYYFPEKVTGEDYYFHMENITYLASVVYNEAMSEYVTPVEDGEEIDGWDLPKSLNDVYYMGDGEPFERTAVVKYSDRTVTYHYNCKPDDHFHDYEIKVITPATCGKDGEATLTCTCGKVITTEIENTGFHVWDHEYKEYNYNVCCKTLVHDAIICKECNGYGMAGYKELPEISMTTTYDYPASEEEEGRATNRCNDCGEEVGYHNISFGNKTITYRSNGIDMVRDFAPGERINVKFEPEKENAEFIGWADENGNIVELPETMPDKNVKYTAIFRTVQKADGFDVTATYDEDCFSKDVEFSVKEIDGESKLGDIYMESGSYYYQIGFYNIKMLDESGATVQPNSGKTVTVKMRIPDEYKGKTDFVVTHWFAEGGREKLSVSNKLAWIEEGYLCFTVSKFSEFAIHVPVSGTVEMSKAPAKTSYIYKEELDLSGIEFVVTGEDGTLETITDTSEMKVSGYDPNTVGEQTVTVECRDVTEEFKVTVSYAWWQWIIRILLLGFLWY